MGNYQLDKVDRQILEILTTDAFTPYTEIARKVNVAPGTVHVRMRKMETAGVVKKPQLQVDLGVLGWDVTAFIGVILTRSEDYDKVVKEVQKIPEVLFCHYITGSYSLFLKVTCRDTRHLRDVLSDRIQKINGISRTETLISLEETFNRQLKWGKETM